MKSVFAALLPPAVVTTTLAVPAVPTGVVQLIVVALTTLTFVAAAANPMFILVEDIGPA